MYTNVGFRQWVFFELSMLIPLPPITALRHHSKRFTKRGLVNLSCAISGGNKSSRILLAQPGMEILSKFDINSWVVVDIGKHMHAYQLNEETLSILIMCISRRAWVYLLLRTQSCRRYFILCNPLNVSYS